MWTPRLRPTSSDSAGIAVADGKGGAERALGIVAVGDGGAENRHDAVADVLVDVPAMVGNDAVDQLEKAVEERVHIFAVQAIAEPGEAREIREEHCNLPPLPGRL